MKNYEAFRRRGDFLLPGSAFARALRFGRGAGAPGPSSFNCSVRGGMAFGAILKVTLVCGKLSPEDAGRLLNVSVGDALNLSESLKIGRAHV